MGEVININIRGREGYDGVWMEIDLLLIGDYSLAERRGNHYLRSVHTLLCIFCNTISSPSPPLLSLSLTHLKSNIHTHEKRKAEDNAHQKTPKGLFYLGAFFKRR